MNTDVYKKCLKIPGISAISFKDFSLYTHFLAGETSDKSYSHSWTFLMQAGRWTAGQFGLKYCPDRHTLITIGFRVDRFIIARPLGKNAFKYLPRLIHHLSRAANHSIYIKKLSEHETEKLSHPHVIDIKHAPDFHPWSSKEPEDDDTFPEVILDIRQSLDLSIPNPALANFRGKVNRFKRFDTHVEFIADIGMCYNDLHSFVNRYRVGTEDSPMGFAYAAMLQTLKIDPTQEKIKWFVARIHKKVVGFFLAEATSEDTAALYASLSHRSHKTFYSAPGLSEYLYRAMMEKLYTEGFTYLNLGGSESKTLHAYKLKFNPVMLKKHQLLVAGN